MEEFGPAFNSKVLVRISLEKRLPELRKKIYEDAKKEGLGAVISIEEPLRREILDALYSELEPRGLYLKKIETGNPTGDLHILTNDPTGCAHIKIDEENTKIPLFKIYGKKNTISASRAKSKRLIDVTDHEVLRDLGKDLNDRLLKYGLYIRVLIPMEKRVFFITDDPDMGWTPSQVLSKQNDGIGTRCKKWCFEIGRGLYEKKDIRHLVENMTLRGCKCFSYPSKDGVVAFL
jgi:hypothetical protein